MNHKGDFASQRKIEAISPDLEALLVNEAVVRSATQMHAMEVGLQLPSRQR